MNLTQLMQPMPMFFRRHKLVQLLLRLSPESNVQVVEFNGGAKLYADLYDAFPRSNFLTRSFEPEFFEIAAPFLKQGGILFDVGANFGFCTFGLLHQLAGTSLECHLFEANPQICALLNRSLEFYPNRKVYINSGCVSNTAGMSSLKVVCGHLGASHIAADGTLQVPNLTLDEYAAKKGVSEIDFLKMDIEGFEPRALEGARRLFQETRVKALYIEISSETLARQGATPENCFRFLSGHDYVLFYVKPIDLENPAFRNRRQALTVHGETVQVIPLENFPKNHQTDILALPKNSPFLKSSK